VKFNSLDFWSTQNSSFITKENFCAIFQSKLQLGSEYIQNLHLLWGYLILSLMDHISDNASGNIELSWNILPTNHDNGNFFSFLSPDILQTSEILANDDNFKGIETVEYQSDEIKWESLLKLAETNSHGPFTKTKKELSLGKWSEGEHRLFVYLINTKYSYGQWKEISSFFPNRTPQQCRSRGSTLFQKRKRSNSKVRKTSSK
jgi:RNAse (barnase) inhibitor barstar